ncbi:MAG: FtsX-like permease family protein [Cyclobacteriaceae bacterium]
MSLEEKISDWKRELRRHKYLEDGAIMELEDHLRDEIITQREKGHDDAEAFEIAVRKIGDIDALEDNERQALSTSNALVPALLRNFLKVANRIFRKNKLTSTINLLGLTSSFTAIIFIGLFIYDELSYEKHHPDYEKIYRLSYSYQEDNGKVEERAYGSGMWIDLLADRVPAIEDHFRFLTISYGFIYSPATNESFYDEGIYWSDPNFFEFLKFRLKYGDPASQLQNLNSIVLTEKTATKIFGEENPVGKNLEFKRTRNSVSLVVTGVIYDPPSNSLFQPDYIANIQAIQGIYGDENRGWVDQNPRPGYVFTYIKINDAANVASVSKELQNIWKETIPDWSTKITPLLTPLSTIHFNPPIKWEPDTPIDMSYIYALVIVGIFILVIALTNFINLITAQSSKRQKEIGLRKTLGSTATQLQVQFFIESSLTVFVSIIVAFGIAYLLTPNFNFLINKNIDFINTLTSTPFIISTLAIILGIMIVTGLLPAIQLTKRLSNRGMNMNQFFEKEKVNATGRNVLVVVQFTVAITLVISTVTVFNQLQLINNGHLGKSREAVLGIRTSRMGDSIQAQRYKAKIQQIPNVIANTLGMHLPRQTDFGRIDTRYYADITGDEQHYWNKFDADGGFLKTYDLKLIAGRDFEYNIEPRALIVNEALVKALGISPEDALGLALREDSINYVYWASDGVIVGVVEDFVYKSVKEQVEPLVICANNYVEGVLSVKLGTGDKRVAIETLESSWKEVYPDRPFEYWFLDKEFNRMYNQERRLGKLIPIFSGLAIVIAMLGLFTLSVYISELRKKEIGIRKVLGCSTKGILQLLSWQYIRTLLPAIFISVPVAYVGLTYWLNNFTYRVSVDFAVITFSVIAVVAISIATTCYKSFRVATSNPIDSLRTE